MTKKNMHIALSSLVLLGGAAALQAEEVAEGQTEALLDYATLGTGEEIRQEILAEENQLEENLAEDVLAQAYNPDTMPEDDDGYVQPQDQRNQRKRKNGSNNNGNNNGSNNGNNNGNKTPQGKCGEGTCS